MLKLNHLRKVFLIVSGYLISYSVSIGNNIITVFGVSLMIVLSLTSKKSDFVLSPIYVSLGQSLLLIPWTKAEFRVVSIPIIYLPFFIYGIITLIKLVLMRVVKGKPLPSSVDSRLVSVIFVFILFLTLTVLWSVIKEVWFVYYVQWIVYILLIFLGTTILFGLLDNETKTRCLKEFKILLIFIALSGLFKYVFLGYPDSNPFLQLNRNGSLFFFIPTFSLYFMSTINRKIAIVDLLGIIVIVFSLLLLFSRTGYLSILFSVITLTFVSFKSSVSFRLRFFLVMILLSILILIGTTFDINIVTNIVSRWKQLILSVEEIFSKADVSYDYRRQALIEGTIDIIRNRFLIGTGLGTGNFLLYFPDGLLEVPARAHNMYLSYLAEFGIIGYTLFLGIFIVILQITLSSKQRNTLIGKRIVIVSFLATLLGFATNEYITLPFIWYMWGILFSEYLTRS